MCHLTLLLTSDKIASSLYGNVMLWIDASFWGSYFTNIFVIVIWILFGIALYVSVAYLWRLRDERPAVWLVAQKAEAAFKSKASDVETVRQRLLKGVPANSVIAERVNELHRTGNQGGDFEQLALAETLAANEGSRTSFVRYVASILVLLGLCGAIYGLSNLVRQMGPELRKMQELSRQTSTNQPGASSPASPQNTSLSSIQESVSALVETMANSLEHTRGAFAASLTGIFFSIIILFVNWFVSQRQVAFLTEVETLTSTKLIPLFKPLPLTFELAGAVNSFNVGAEYAARMASALDELVTRAVESLQMMFAVVRKFEDGADAIKSNQQSMADAQERMLLLAEQFTGLTGRIEQHQAGSMEDISSVTSAVSSNNEYIKEILNEWRRKHEELLLQLDKVARQSIHESKGTKKETQELLAQDINQFRAQVLEGFERQQKFNQDQLSRMLQEQKTYVGDLQRAMLDGQGHKELINGLNDLLVQERDVFSTEFKAFIEPQKSLSEHFKRLVKQQEKLVGRLERLSVALVRPLETSATKIDITHRDEMQTLAQEQRETNQHVQQVSHYAERLIAVAVLFVSGAGSTVAFALLLLVIHLLGFWPDSTGGQFAVLIVLLALSAIAFYVLSSVLLHDDSEGEELTR